MTLMPAFKIGFWNGWIFMSVFLIQMLAMMFAGSRVMKRSHVPAQAREARGKKYIGLMANFSWFLALFYSVFLPFKLGTIWFYIGLLVFIFGVIILILSTVSFMATPHDQLILRGVYRFSRHPMYLSTLFICLGCGVAVGSLLFVLITMVMAFCFHQEALVEESYCLDLYGETYQKYMDSVPRWGGRLKK